jgi:hypothetical protein
MLRKAFAIVFDPIIYADSLPGQELLTINKFQFFHGGAGIRRYVSRYFAYLPMKNKGCSSSCMPQMAVNLQSPVIWNRKERNRRCRPFTHDTR